LGRHPAKLIGIYSERLHFRKISSSRRSSEASKSIHPEHQAKRPYRNERCEAAQAGVRTRVAIAPVSRLGQAPEAHTIVSTVFPKAGEFGSLVADDVATHSLPLRLVENWM